MNKIFAPFLPPWVETGLQPAFYDMESGTVLQQTARMYAKVQQLTRLFNELSEETRTIVEEYIAKFTELKDFVDDFFDNLDLQEEVNNKLDAMAEDGTLAEALKKITCLDVSFMKQTLKTGDCALLTLGNKSLMIDTHHEQEYDIVKGLLADKGVTHLDYVVITHYHADHYGNFENLFTDGYIDTDTRVFLPATTETFGTVINEGQEEILQFCEHHNLNASTPTPFEVYELAPDWTIDFFNCDGEVMDTYPNYSSKDGNDTSMLAFVQYKNTKLLFTADARPEVLKRAYDEKFHIEKVNFYKIEHHGINTGTCGQWLNALNPDYAVQSGGLDAFSLGEYSRGQTTQYLKGFGAKVFPTFLQKQYITLATYGEDIFEKTGRGGAYTEAVIERNIYVDGSSQNLIQDGTMAYPYRSIATAISDTHYDQYYHTNIYVADGRYGYELDAYPITSRYNCINVENKTGFITIQSQSGNAENVILNGVFAEGCDLTLYRVSVDCKNHNDGVYARNAHVICNEVNFLTSDNNMSAGNGVYGNGANIFCDKCNFTNVTTAISLNYGSKAGARDNTFDNIGGDVKIVSRGCQLIESGDTYVNDSLKIADYKNGCASYSAVTLYENETAEFSSNGFDLNYDSTDFDAIMIQYEDDQGTVEGTILTAMQTHWATLKTINVGSGKITLNSTAIQIKTKQLGYKANAVTVINNNANPTVTATRHICVTKVIGLLYDKIDRTVSA